MMCNVARRIGYMFDLYLLGTKLRANQFPASRGRGCASGEREFTWAGSYWR